MQPSGISETKAAAHAVRGTGWQILPRRTTWIVLSTFLVLGILSTFYLFRHYRSQERLFLDKLTASQEVAWRAATSVFRIAAEVYQAAYFHDPEVKDLLRRATDPSRQQEVRQALLELQLPVFLKMQTQGIRQFNYILPDGTCLLRFHASDYHGDNLALTKSAVRLALTEKVPVTSFQITRVGSGYMVVFPVLSESGELLGGVEISMPFSVLEEEVASLDPEGIFELVIFRPVLEPMLLTKEDKRYEVWNGSSDFRKEIRESDDSSVANKFRELSASLASIQRVREILAIGASDSVAFRFQGADFTATLTPIRDISHRLVAYLISYRTAPGLAMLSLNFALSTTVAWVLLGILAAALKLILESWDSVARERTQLRAISNTMAEGLIFLNARGDLVDINDSALRMLKCSRMQLAGGGIDSLFSRSGDSNETKSSLAREIEKIAQQGDRFEEEVALIRKAGSPLPASLAVSPLLRNGELVGSVATFRDITEQKAAREALQKAKEEEAAANRAKSIFLATMSHEIRTPLNAVVGTSSLLIEADLQPEQRDLAETIVSGCEALLSVVNDILDYSRIESGKVELEKERFDVADLAAESLELFAAKAAEKNLNLVYRILPEVPSVVRGDASRLRQVLLNLVSNAVKFTREGEVLLEVRAANLPNHKFRLDVSVRDTGVGIPDRALRRLFSPFEQADASVSRQHGGSGLGLAISKRLVELMEGTIQVWSVPGAGTEFRFFVLVDEVPRCPGLYESQDAVPLKGKKILVAFEHPARRETFSAMLLAWGLEVKLCDRPSDFPAAVADPTIHAVLVDESLLNQAAEMVPPPEVTLPVLVLSNFTPPQVDPFSKVSYLQQPVRPTLLLRTLLSKLCGVELTPKVLSSPSRLEENLKILLAEDNPVNQRVVALMLKKLGCEVDWVSNGLEAVDAVKRKSYAAVLMDIQMPEMDGLRATQEILRNQPDPAKRPKIIALTANALKGDKEVCLDAGMDDYLAKPVRLAELSACIESVRYAKAG